MTAREGILFLVRLHQSSPGAMAQEDWHQAFEIVASNGSSASFKAAQRYYGSKHSGSLEALAFAKGVRWLSILRQEEGEQAFKEVCEQLLVAAGLRQSAVPSSANIRKGQWQLGSGEQVVDRADSHIHSGVQPFLAAAFASINSQGHGFIAEDVDFGINIGQIICVETQPGDGIVFAQRVGRAGLSRFVRNRQPEPTSYVAVVLKQIPDGSYELRSAYLGQLSQPEPWDKYATKESLEFWLKHALCWGYEQIIAGTETTLCPW